MTYFDNVGRRIPSATTRSFSDISQSFYQIKQPEIDYSRIWNNSIKFNQLNSSINFAKACSAFDELKSQIEANPDYSNLMQGVHVPFMCGQFESTGDLGRDLENIQLPNLKNSFNAMTSNHHFKATLQGNSKLASSISIDPRARYNDFLEKCKHNTVVGWYFPQALQQFDIESQRQQMVDLPETKNMCLSGGIDIVAALIGTPNLLISEDFYSPILCLSAYVHADPRLVLLLKSYGPHMEFWCMTQMLKKNVTQVSEQWAGGITFYLALN